MWQKLLIALALKAISAIDWESLLIKILSKLELLIKEKTGLEVSFNNYADEILTLIEAEVEAALPISIDLNRDGK